MSRADMRYIHFTSGLYKATDGLREAIANAPDTADREALQRAEAEVRLSIRRHHLKSPDEERVWWAREWR